MVKKDAQNCTGTKGKVMKNPPVLKGKTSGQFIHFYLGIADFSDA
ncbi:hypothetical protein WMZ97_10785 [Lentibacillus sp. N15]